MRTLELYDPTVDPIPAQGIVAKRPDTLDGAVVGLLANGKPNADALLEMVCESLADRYAFRSVVARNKRNASRPCPTPLIEELAESCDVVITGNGD